MCELFAQAWRPIEVQQTLAALIYASGRFRQCAALAAWDNGLQAGGCAFYFGHAAAPGRDYGQSV
jgi:hypothetical protein